MTGRHLRGALMEAGDLLGQGVNVRVRQLAARLQFGQ